MKTSFFSKRPLCALGGSRRADFSRPVNKQPRYAPACAIGASFGANAAGLSRSYLDDGMLSRRIRRLTSNVRTDETGFSVRAVLQLRRAAPASASKRITLASIVLRLRDSRRSGCRYRPAPDREPFAGHRYAEARTGSWLTPSLYVTGGLATEFPADRDSTTSRSCDQTSRAADNWGWTAVRTEWRSQNWSIKTRCCTPFFERTRTASLYRVLRERSPKRSISRLVRSTKSA